MQSQKTGERTGSRPSAAEGGGAPAPALRPADHRSTSKTQLLPGDRALLPPSPAGPTASLTPASRCQDHTTSPSASCIARLAHSLRPPHPAPTSVTFAKRPSEWNGTANHIARFLFRKNRNIFANGAGQTVG